MIINAKQIIRRLKLRRKKSFTLLKKVDILIPLQNGLFFNLKRIFLGCLLHLKHIQQKTAMKNSMKLYKVKNNLSRKSLQRSTWKSINNLKGE